MPAVTHDACSSCFNRASGESSHLIGPFKFSDDILLDALFYVPSMNVYKVGTPTSRPNTFCTHFAGPQHGLRSSCLNVQGPLTLRIFLAETPERDVRVSSPDLSVSRSLNSFRCDGRSHVGQPSSDCNGRPRARQSSFHHERPLDTRSVWVPSLASTQLVGTERRRSRDIG